MLRIHAGGPREAAARGKKMVRDPMGRKYIFKEGRARSARSARAETARGMGVWSTRPLWKQPTSPAEGRQSGAHHSKRGHKSHNFLAPHGTEYPRTSFPTHISLARPRFHQGYYHPRPAQLCLGFVQSVKRL